jgi:hypothetical protein
MQKEPLPWVEHKTSDVACNRISVGERILPPTETGIKAMMESMSGPAQQINPIQIARLGAEGFKVVTGATRLEAARRLKWEKIKATHISCGTPYDYQILECEENLSRRDLTDKQRDDLKTKVRALKDARFAAVRQQMENPHISTKPTRAPRKHRFTGKKPEGRPEGGLAKATREHNVPRTTAQDKLKKERALFCRNDKNRQKRAPIKPTVGLAPLGLKANQRQISVRFNAMEVARLKQKADDNAYSSVSEFIRKIVLDALNKMDRP